MATGRAVLQDLQHTLMHVALYASNEAHRNLALRYLGISDVLFAGEDEESARIYAVPFDEMLSHQADARDHIEQNDLKSALESCRASISLMPGKPGWQPDKIPPVPR